MLEIHDSMGDYRDHWAIIAYFLSHILILGLSLTPFGIIMSMDSIDPSSITASLKGGALFWNIIGILILLLANTFFYRSMDSSDREKARDLSMIMCKWIIIIWLLFLLPFAGIALGTSLGGRSISVGTMVLIVTILLAMTAGLLLLVRYWLGPKT